MSRILTLLIAGLAMTLNSGCAEKTVSVDVRTERQTFELNARPALATTLGEAIKNLKVAEGTPSADEPDTQVAEKAATSLAGEGQVVVEGWADLKFFEARQGEAIFLVREILEDADHGGEGHDPSSCPFCKRRMEAAPKAAVVFAGKDKKALPYDIKVLFPVKHGDKVVIQGVGKIDKNLDLFKITATGIFVPGPGATDEPEFDQQQTSSSEISATAESSRESTTNESTNDKTAKK